MKRLLISLNDPEILNPQISPLFKGETPLGGFIPADFWLSMQFGRNETAPLFRNDPLMLKVEQHFLRITQVGNYSKPPAHSPIPPLIHFIWLGSSLPLEFEPVIATWRRCHPGWEIKIWTEKELASFVWSSGYSKWLMDNAQNVGEKADIWRYEILYQWGGIYSDLDVICYKSFNDLIAQGEFIGGQETNQIQGSQALYMSNALFGVAKGHRIMKYCIDHLTTQQENPSETIMQRTGPFLLTRACQEALEDSDRVLVLPCSYFYPLPHFSDLSHKMLTAQQIASHYVSPESMVLHLWAATWYID